MPLPMNSTANRFGSGPAVPSAEFPHAGNDSIHGSAIVTPMPRRTVRLETLISFTFWTATFANPDALHYGSTEDQEIKSCLASSREHLLASCSLVQSRAGIRLGLIQIIPPAGETSRTRA